MTLTAQVQGLFSAPSLSNSYFYGNTAENQSLEKFIFQIKQRQPHTEKTLGKVSIQQVQSFLTCRSTSEIITFCYFIAKGEKRQFQEQFSSS